MKKHLFGTFLALMANLAVSQNQFDSIANAPFIQGRPTEASAQLLADELLFQRATQVYLWAMPLVNTLGMKVASERVFGAGYNVLPIWKKRLDARTLITTPNSDVLYAMNYINLAKDGPMVMDAPSGLQGILMDVWQRPLKTIDGRFSGDIGLPGPDAGKGGKFLILPPGYKGAIPKGYYVYQSKTNNIFVFLRGFYKDPNDLTPAAEHIAKTKFYPLDKKVAAKPMIYPDASGIPINMLPIKDASIFSHLKVLLDEEGENLADPDWRGMMASLGMKTGAPFSPDSRTLETLNKAAMSGYKMSRSLAFADMVGGVSYKIYPDRHWSNPFADGTPKNQTGVNTLIWFNKENNFLDLDGRINYFTNYYSTSMQMLSVTPGVGANYLMAFVDSKNSPLTGDLNYRIKLPSPVPAENFWSIALYDAENSSGLANGQPFPSLGSRDNPLPNPDGSFDIYISQKPPSDNLRKNWIATVPGKGFFVILRLYGPGMPVIDRSWKPGDLEVVR